MTKIKVYSCYTVKIYKKQTQKNPSRERPGPGSAFGLKFLASILQYDLSSLYENCEIRELLGKGFWIRVGKIGHEFKKYIDCFFIIPGHRESLIKKLGNISEYHDTQLLPIFIFVRKHQTLHVLKKMKK